MDERASSFPYVYFKGEKESQVLALGKDRKEEFCKEFQVKLRSLYSKQRFQRLLWECLCKIYENVRHVSINWPFRSKLSGDLLTHSSVPHLLRILSRILKSYVVYPERSLL